MKVCHVNFARGYRGGERQTELLIRELSGMGITQRAIVRKGSDLSQRLAGIPALDLRPIGSPFFLHTGLSRGWLLHAHESRAAHYSHNCNLLAGASYIVTRRVDNAPSNSFLTRGLYRRASAVVAISSAIRKILAGYLSALDPRIIPSAHSSLSADAGMVAKIRSRWPGRFLVGHVGALDNSQKGQLYLIRAARHMAVTHPQLHFVLLGEGVDEAWFRREAKELPNISFEGYVENVGDYLAAFDLFVFPSLHEGLGSVLLDAMSFGLPIVATAVDGIPDIVHDGQNGLLVPPADDRRLADAIARLYADTALREKLGLAGQNLCRQYSPAIMASAYLALYREASARP